MDCAGVCFGESVTDDCGDCVDPIDYNGAMDCNGVCYGNAFMDDCDVCSEGDTGHPGNSDMDCADVCFGTAQMMDYCFDYDGDMLGDGENSGTFCDALVDPGWVTDCSDEDDNCYSNYHDCMGTCDGEYVMDDCGDCVNPAEFNGAMDCNNVCDGSAVIDDCDVCSGGSTGHEPNSDQDCADVCFGDSLIDECGFCSDTESFNWAQDCAGVCFGYSLIDDCGYCSDPANFNGAMDCAGVCDGPNYEDVCGICDDISENDGADLDCADVCFGSALTDDCGVCSEGTTGHVSNSDQDCAGDCFGDSLIDECGVCDDDPANNGADDLGCGCFIPAPLTYYYDTDLDGWGAGDGLQFCFADVPENWVSNNEDVDNNIYCLSNIIDVCGVCDGGNTADGTGFVSGPDADCMGTCFGTSIEDDCGVCNGDGSSCNTPIALAQTITTDEDIALDFTLDASDPTGDPLTVIVIQAPTHGTMTITGEIDANYSPDPEYSGADVYKYKVTDNTWTSAIAIVTINVTTVDDPPLAQSLTYSVIEDQTVNAIMSGTDIDTDDATLTFEINSEPANGVLNTNRSIEAVEYVPNANFNGTDSFTYYAFDGNSYSSLATITFNVSAVNDAPTIPSVISSTGSFSLDENTSLEFTVTMFDVEGNNLELLLQNGPYHGSVSGAYPTYTYTPNQSYSGTDVLIIKARETDTPGHLTSAPRTVTFSVINVNDPPVVNDLTRSMNEDATRTVTLAGSDLDGDPFTFALVDLPENGTATRVGAVVTYTPYAEYNGVDTFTYTATDSFDNTSEPGTVTINIANVNDAPIVEDLEFFDVTDGYEFSVIVNDVDLTDTHTIDMPDGLFGGTVTGPFDGIYTYHLNGNLYDLDLITYTASDGVTSSNLGVIILNIPLGTRHVNRTAPVALDQFLDVAEDVPIQVTLLGVDLSAIMDEDAGFDIIDGPFHGQFPDLTPDEFNENIITSLASYTPDDDWFGLDSLHYTIINAGITSEPATIFYQVNPVNDLPEFMPLDGDTSEEDIAVTKPFFWDDPDSDVLITVYATPSLDGLILQTETMPDTTGGYLYITPPANYFGTVTITMIVTELGEGGATSTESFDVTFTPVNDQPKFVEDVGEQDALEGQIVEIDLTPMLLDVDGDTQFNFEINFSDNAGLDDISIEGNLFSFTPINDFAGQISGEIIVTDNFFRDGEGEPDTSGFNINWDNINDPPVPGDIPPITVSEDSGPIIITFAPTDVDSNAVLTVANTMNNYTLFPESGISIDPDEPAPSGVDRTITLTPGANKFGTAILGILVSDGEIEVEVQVNITVTAVNDAPDLTAVGTITVQEDHTTNTDLNASDVDNTSGDMVFSVDGGTNIAVSIDNLNNLSVIPTANWFGSETVTVTVCDSHATDELCDSEEVTITVTSVNDQPSITSVAGTVARTSVEYTYQAVVADVDDTEFSYSLGNAPAGMEVSLTGLVTWSPATRIFTSGAVTLTAQDDENGSSSQTFTISVIQVDCAGVDNGSAFIDDCGECVGGTTGLTANWAMDCAGVCFGPNYEDTCGVCDDVPENDDVDMDCAGVCFGTAIVESYCSDGDSDGLGLDGTQADFCNASIGEGYVSDCSDADDDCFTNIHDCFGVCDGVAVEDCAGVCDGESLVDDCGDCALPDDFNGAMDCAGVCNGSAIEDDCGVCSGGASGHEPNTDFDCAGVCFGESVVDECDDCVLPENFNGGMDDCGVCYGGNASMDCAGVCDGTAFVDECGVCDGPGLSTYCDDTDVDGLGFGNSGDYCPDGTPGFDVPDGFVGNCDDACPSDFDNDIDSDGVCGDVDNCPDDSNTNQSDNDGDLMGDVCDICPNDSDNDIDSDGTCGDVDNCPDDANTNQSDFDVDGFGDVCDAEPDGEIAIDFGAIDGVIGTFDIDYDTDMYNNTVDVYGFQFMVSGVTLIDASTTNPGFTVSVNPANGTVIGFSLSQAFYPSGTGTLATVTFEVGEVRDICLSDVTIAGSVGHAPEVIVDGECASSGLCDSVDTDGDLWGDVCDICPNDPLNDEDGDGVCGDVDMCPGGDDAIDIDCAGVCFGESDIDDCGDCVLLVDFNGAMDCADVCDGTAVEDCAGVCEGTAYVDECDVCDDDPLNDCVQDCTGEWGGPAVVDCANVCEGTAYMNECGCVEGTTGLPADWCLGIDVSIGVEAGWNWFSMNVIGDDMGLNAVLSNLGDDQVYIKNQSMFAEYYGGYGWFGGLENIGVTDFYMLQTLASGSIEYNGLAVDAANTPIDLFTGWNWVGYTPQGAQDINVALDGIGENGVYVKNQTAFAEYYAGYGWFGGLANMSPFNGYMLQMTADDVLTYPESGPVLSGSFNGEAEIAQLLRDNAAEWQVNPADYQYNGSVTALITISGGIQINENDILAAFVGNDCRGISTGQYFPITDETVFMIMVFSNETSGEELSFRFYDSSMDMYYGFDEGVEFQVNMTVGSAIDPYSMDNSYLLGIDDVLPTEYALSQAYPNPFNPVTTLNYTVKELGDVNITVYDMMGREITQLVDDRKAPGTYQVTWDANQHPSGIYFVRMTSGVFTTIQKVMLVK